jgi:hypothetical protein
MLTNQKAEAIAEARRGGMAIAIRSRDGGSVPAGLSRGYFRRPAQLLDRAETNAIGFSKRAIDGACLCNAHLRAPNQGGDIGGIGVAVANEPFRSHRFVNCRLEDPTVCGRVTKLWDHPYADTHAATSAGQPHETRMRDVPRPIDKPQITSSH